MALADRSCLVILGRTVLGDRPCYEVLRVSVDAKITHVVLCALEITRVAQSGMMTIFVHHNGHPETADPVDPAWLDPASGALVWVDLAGPTPEELSLLSDVFHFIHWRWKMRSPRRTTQRSRATTATST